MKLAKRQMRHAIASTIYILALFGVPAIAHALSCAPRQFTLEEAYETADSIIVGLITECKDEVSRDPWANGGSECSFSSIEVLKESIPAREYSGVTSSSGCGLSLHVGGQYLLFLDGENQPMHFSAALGGDQYKDQLANRYLQIIRDFRSGAIEDLSEPWTFVESGGYCSIWQTSGSNQIRFSRRTANAPTQPIPNWTQVTLNGQTAYKANVPALDAETNTPAGTVEIVAFGDSPEYFDDALSLSVHLREASPAPVRQVTLSVDSRNWSLNRVDMNLSLPGSISHSVVAYYAGGEAAEQILSAMAEPSDIVVSATVIAPTTPPEPPDDPPPDQESFVRPFSSDSYLGQAPSETSSTRPVVMPRERPAGSYGAKLEPPQPILRVQSRSTQLSAEIESFRACYSGDE